MKRAVIAFGCALVLTTGCGGDKVAPVMKGPPSKSTEQTPAATASAPSAMPATPKAAEYTENDFVESERNRDPFRSFASQLIEQGQRPTANQRSVLLGQYPIEELRLVAIVLGEEYPRAMLIDPSGKGWVVKRGDYLGRPEVVHTGGSNGADYQLNWRIERIR